MADRPTQRSPGPALARRAVSPGAILARRAVSPGAAVAAGAGVGVAELAHLPWEVAVAAGVAGWALRMGAA
ncbi:MAG: hypothetical protein ACRDY0_10020, partial [Acidimicrobiales bacterium]